mmetsp:Transcript_39105/g.94122  ORF Transcript_39105/g.94122 Transcript_39105/m.94122 type:complete len:684 (-) Transcript_39105:717-2768(-)
MVNVRNLRNTTGKPKKCLVQELSVHLPGSAIGTAQYHQGPGNVPNINIDKLLTTHEATFHPSGSQPALLMRLRRPRRILSGSVRPAVDVEPPCQMLLDPPIVRLWYAVRPFRASTDHHVETVHGVDRRAGLHPHVRGGSYQSKVEFVHDHGQSDTCFDQRKLVPDALPLPGPEWKEGIVARNLVRIQAVLRHLIRIVTPPSLHARILEWPLPPRRVVPLRILPVLRRAMQIPRRDENVRPPQHLDASEARAAGGEGVLHPCATDEHGRLGVEAQGLDQCHPRLFHFDDVLVVRTGFGAHDRTDLGLDLRHEARVVAHESKHGPCEHRRRSLVSRNEHGHQIVPEDLARQILPPHIRQEPQQARIVPRLPLLKLLHRGLLTGLDRPVDELREYVVEHAHILSEFDLSPHPFTCVRQIPVGYERRRSVLRLAQHAVHCLDHRRLLRHRSEIVVEHGLADDVEGDGAESLFHVEGGLDRGVIVEIGAETIAAVAEEADHAVEPAFVKARDDGPSSHLPNLWIGRDKPISHNRLQYLRQHPLTVLFRTAIPQYMPGHDRIANDQKALGTEAQIEYRSVILIVLREQQKERPSRQRLEVAPQRTLYEGEERSLVFLDDGIGYGRHAQRRSESESVRQILENEDYDIERIDGTGRGLVIPIPHYLRGGVIHEEFKDGGCAYPGSILLLT